MPTLACLAQVSVWVNLNVAHSVDTVERFDRSKFITIHADQAENEWLRDNFTPNLLHDFLNGFDVYMGRNTGGITWNLNQVKEDPLRPGFADPTDVTARGQNSRNNYAGKNFLHPYEDRNRLIIAGQLHPFWTGDSQRPTGKGWSLANATATGEYMGQYIKAFHGNGGPPLPAFVEVINEPAYESLGGPSDYTHSIREIADFHVGVADAIRAQVPEVRIGGYTTAFPNFEVGNFQRWENRWKLFMDIAGEKMDFWSIHLYDFPSINNGKKRLRSGGNMEATFDMMEQYSQMSFGRVKPFVISEYGAQMHDYSKQQWSPFRDWLHLKAQNAQMMSFLERPNLIDIAVNFVIVKAEWGYNNGIPYNHRLMRKANEPTSYTGEWVYTDMVKFYELWENVKGRKVDARSNDLDIQVAAYVDGPRAYIILNNLEFEKRNIQIDVSETFGIPISQIVKKHLTLSGDRPVLEEVDFEEPVTSLEIGAESTIILEYTFAGDLTLDATSHEVKYYADRYLQPIVAGEAVRFEINSVQKGQHGAGILRLGIGRDHGRSLNPQLTLNGTELCVPQDWRGDDQADRSSFFGLLEIPFPYELLNTDNEISISFNDAGGHISSVSIQAFEFSRALDWPAVCSLVPVRKLNRAPKTMRIHPNPAGKTFHFTLPDENIAGQLSIIDGNGRSVQQEWMDTITKPVDISSLSSGLYIVSFQTERYLYTQKLIVH